MPSAVQLLKLPDDGVPKTGVTKVGEVDKTTEPVPVEDVTPVPPLATGSAVPDQVTANVPRVVRGLPDTDKIVGTVIATDETEPVALVLEANRVTVPALFLAYSFMSAVLSANSPAIKLPEVGTAAAVAL